MKLLDHYTQNMNITIHIVKINKNSVNEGNGKEVDQINSRYNFHSIQKGKYII